MDTGVSGAAGAGGGGGWINHSLSDEHYYLGVEFSAAIFRNISENIVTTKSELKQLAEARNVQAAKKKKCKKDGTFRLWYKIKTVVITAHANDQPTAFMMYP